MEEQAPALESFIPLSLLPSVFISASLSITLQADYFISKASIMNNVSFLSSFFLELFAHCDLAFGPVTDWWAIFGARTTAGRMRDGGVGSNKRGREAQRQNRMPPSHHRLSHQIPVEAK